MFYYLLYRLADSISFLNVTRYITFRIMVALLSALFISFVLSPWFIKKLKKRQIGQQVRDLGPQSHLTKAGTPTMGGGLILLALLLPALLWTDLSNAYFWYIFVITAAFGMIGYWDDHLKIAKKNPQGMRGKHKLIVQFIISLLVCAHHYFFTLETTELVFPFFKNLTLDIGPFYILFGAFVIVGTSHSVNLTDGLDGLAIGPVMTSAFCFVVLAYVTGHYVIAEYLNYHFIKGSGELAIFAATIIGAGLGFLWYNTYPAQVFMGDIGSLSLGGALGTLAFLTKHELLMIIIGGLFVVEALSVIAQVVSFKLTGRRVLKMAPIHHHFELRGWPEPRIIVRFWIISIILALIALLSLKLR